MKNEKEQPFTNIDFLSVGRNCNQTCRQCFYAERWSRRQPMEQEIGMIKRIMDTNPKSAFFVYPKDVSTSPEVIALAGSIGQERMLTNGKTLTAKPEIIGELKRKGIEMIRITLFGSEEEQQFWNGNTPEEYQAIKEGIELCVEGGLCVEVFSMITPQNIGQLPEAHEEDLSCRHRAFSLLHTIQAAVLCSVV